jgi:hypothetical protein
MPITRRISNSNEGTMSEQPVYLIEQIIHNKSYTFESLVQHLKDNPEDISKLKKALVLDTQDENHELIIKYIQKQSPEKRRELFEEVCKIYRKPFLTHRSSLSRVLIVNQEVFLHIIKNDKRFFRDGPERTSVNIIEETLDPVLRTFFPHYFTKEKNVRKKEIYDALMILEDESNPSLITTTKLRPGTGTGKRRRKRYCLTDDGFHEIIPIVITVLRDELENLANQI